MYLRFVFFYRVLPGVPPEANSSSFYWWEVLNWNQDQVTPFLQMVTEFFIFFFFQTRKHFSLAAGNSVQGVGSPDEAVWFLFISFLFFFGRGDSLRWRFGESIRKSSVFFSFFFKSNESITYSNGSIILDYFFFEIQRQFLWLYLRGRGKRHK